MTRAVVFAYHDVGVRCLKTLLARGVDVSMVVTHADDPHESIWFASVAETAHYYGIAVSMPERDQFDRLRQELEGQAPDFLFSFYYRHMLPASLLDLPQRGAFNMHGSLLPKYRGRVPVNWAILKGETETGATLHEMTVKPDAGAIIDQTAVPILPDDTALDVFRKVTVAAEQTLWRALPGLIDGSALRRPNRLDQGHYFGGRKPEDGRIDWSQPRADVYNLIRAVAPPYPGAFCDLPQGRLTIEAARPISVEGLPPVGLVQHGGRVLGVCGDGLALWLERTRLNSTLLEPDALASLIENKTS